MNLSDEYLQEQEKCDFSPKTIEYTKAKSRHCPIKVHLSTPVHRAYLNLLLCIAGVRQEKEEKNQR